MFPGTHSTYHDFARYDFTVDGCEVIVVAPHQPALVKPPAGGKAWVWRAEFFDHEPLTDLRLVERGFHLVFMQVNNTFGCPWAMDRWESLYALLTGEYGFAARHALIGLSRGGLYCYNWAARHPDRVACIYADNAVCDFKSWPGGFGRGPGSTHEWLKLLNDYGFASTAEALAYTGNPVDNLEPLARANVALMHVYGDADQSVPWEENTGVIAERYRALGGRIVTICKPGCEHHPHCLEDPTPVVDFIAEACGV